MLRRTVASCRQWSAEAKRGLRDLIDLESLTLGAEESRHVDKPEPSSGPVRSKHAARPTRSPASANATPAPSSFNALADTR